MGRLAIVALSCLMAASFASADRAPDDRKTAKFVFEGVVESVETSEDGEHDWYLVKIKIEKVDKGDGLKVGETFKATCYRRERSKPKSFASGGHGFAPPKGTRIKAYVSDHNTHGGFEGVYPEWFDKLDKK